MAPLGLLPGVGPITARRLAEAVGGSRVLDLLFHLPDRYAVRTAVDSPADAPADTEVVLRATVRGMRAARSRNGRPYVEVRTESAGRRLLLRYMHGRLTWLKECLPEGTERVFAGKVAAEGAAFAMLNPLSTTPAAGFPLLEPVWPLVKDLRAPQLARAMDAALRRVPILPEWHEPALLRREGWPTFAAALRAVQAPVDGPPEPAALARLAYDEALAGQLAVALVRRAAKQRPGRALRGDGMLRARALAAFGHEPTPAQVAALAEIDADLAAPHRMLRLLQGDVGSGKTLVAVLAMLRAVEAGAQAALMAPTELLARQHARTLGRLCTPAGVRVELLAGSIKGAQRRRVLTGLSSGAVGIVVGTHALFQDGVTFQDLALAVVDEQHRFGVTQRLLLAGKGESVDLLVMTATPIPRTLLLTQWGEMAVSRLAGKPAGRQTIATTLHGLGQLDAVLDGVARALSGGARIYWVCPHVAETEASDIAAAETRYADLAARFPGLVALAHGRLNPEVREAALASFAAGRSRILVATTVIEVGVDVPEATVMVVERADRFGLAQLHQLRGRVGRGTAASYCMLLCDEGLPAIARQRLLILRDTEDGFRIADEDFRLRGAGDALGTRQSGNAVFRLALTDTEAQAGLLAMASQDAAYRVQRDPDLQDVRADAARTLLALFGRDAPEAKLNAG